MATYQYTAFNQNGKQVKGKIEAGDIPKAERLLKNQGLIPVKVATPTLLDAEVNTSMFGKGTSPRDMAVFCSQMTSLLHAGVAIVDAFEMLENQTSNKVLRNALIDTRAGIAKGEPLGETMKKHPEAFDEMLVNMVEAGEASGSIENSFHRMGIQFEKSAKIKGMVKSAMTYPIIVLIIAVAVVIVMLKVVIPNFVGMFAELDTELPAITKAVMAFSDWMKQYWIAVIVVVIVLAIGFNIFKSTATGQVIIGRVSMKLPLVGNLINKQAAANFSRTMSTLLSSGISIVDALKITRKNMPNVLYKDAMDLCIDEVEKGTPLTQPVTNCGLFPPMTCHMVKIGEETGNIETMLDKSAEYFEEEVEMATASLMKAMEPLMIILLAGIVGVLLAACLAPMMTMYEALDNM